jgi:hypothetical protein
VVFCVDVPVEGEVAWPGCDEVGGWFCVVDLSGFFDGVLVGDCAYAAVANAMPIAVVANKRILIVRSCFEALFGDNPSCRGRFLSLGKNGQCGEEQDCGFRQILRTHQLLEMHHPARRTCNALVERIAALAAATAACRGTIAAT